MMVNESRPMRRAARRQAVQPMQRLRRQSRWMVRACQVLLVLLPLALVAYWLAAPDTLLLRHANLPASALVSPLSLWQRLAAGGVMLLPLACLLVGVWHARACFQRFAQGEVFTTEATSRLRRMAGWVAAASGLALLAGMAVSVLLTVHQPAGDRHLVLALGSDQVFTLFFAALVWLMAAVIGQGQALDEENRGFV